MLLIKQLAIAGLCLFSELNLTSALPHPAEDLEKRATTTTSAYPTPTVPLGNGGPIATRSGRMFNIQSKVQYFAGK